MRNCPICNKDYTNLDASESVCKAHSDSWMVTVCSECGQTVYSQYAGACMDCMELKPQSIHHIGLGFSHDRRAVLRFYGLE